MDASEMTSEGEIENRIDRAEPVLTGEWCRSTGSEKAGFHPGGIQAIGRYAVVPVYPNTRPSCSEIQVWSDTLERTNVFRIRDREAFAVGITNIGNRGYLLAVVVRDDGKEIRLYWASGALEQCAFSPIATYMPARGYPNSITLLADTKDTPYLLGLYLERACRVRIGLC